MTRVLVTGATGFIGRALCPALSAAGYDVIAGLRRGTGGGDVRVIGDLGGGADPAPALAGIDVVVHLAARVHVMRERAVDPLAEFRRVNVDGTVRLAEAAREAGVGRFVFLSSIKVNGESTSGARFTEDDPPAPEDAYGDSKWEAEQALARLSGGGAIETVILRAPLVYGPGVGANFLSLLKLCDSGLPLPFGGVTANARSLIYVGNLADAIRTALDHRDAAGRTWLLSDGEDLSTAGLVRRIRRALGRPARLVPVPVTVLGGVLAIAGHRPVADRLTGSLAVDSGRIRRELGWSPPFTVDQGLAATVAWYRGPG